MHFYVGRAAIHFSIVLLQIHCLLSSLSIQYTLIIASNVSGIQKLWNATTYVIRIHCCEPTAVLSFIRLHLEKYFLITVSCLHCMLTRTFMFGIKLDVIHQEKAILRQSSSISVKRPKKLNCYVAITFAILVLYSGDHVYDFV